jgi:hypothetical protein
VFDSVHAAADACVAVSTTTQLVDATQAHYERVYAVYRDAYAAMRGTMHALAGL